MPPADAPTTSDLSLDDSSRLRVPLKWLVAIGLGCLTLGGSYAVGEVQLSSHSTQLDQHAERIKEREHADVELERRQSVTDERYETLLKTMQRLEAKIDDEVRRHHP